MKQIKSQNQPWSHVLMGKFTLKCANYTVVVFYRWGSLLLQWQQWSLPMMTSPVWRVPLWTALCPSARSSPHLPQSSVCCVGTQQLFVVSVVYYLPGHPSSMLHGHTQWLFVVSVVYYLPGHCSSCRSHLYAAWSHSGRLWWVLCIICQDIAPPSTVICMPHGHTQRLYVVNIMCCVIVTECYRHPWENHGRGAYLGGLFAKWSTNDEQRHR